jgi:hypothetical protein
MVYIIALASLWAGLYLAIYAGVTNPLVGIAIAIVFPITILATWGAKPKPAPKPQPTPTKPPEPTIKVGRDAPLTKITCDTLGAALNKVLDENDAKTVAEGKVLTEADRKQLRWITGPLTHPSCSQPSSRSTRSSDRTAARSAS